MQSVRSGSPGFSNGNDSSEEFHDENLQRVFTSIFFFYVQQHSYNTTISNFTIYFLLPHSKQSARNKLLTLLYSSSNTSNQFPSDSPFHGKTLAKPHQKIRLEERERVEGMKLICMESNALDISRNPKFAGISKRKKGKWAKGAVEKDRRERAVEDGRRGERVKGRTVCERGRGSRLGACPDIPRG